MEEEDRIKEYEKQKDYNKNMKNKKTITRMQLQLAKKNRIIASLLIMEVIELFQEVLN